MRTPSTLLALGLACGLLVTVPGCADDLDTGTDDASGVADLSGGGGGGDLAVMPPRDLAGGPGPDGGGGQPDLASAACPDKPFSTFASTAIRFVNPKCRFTAAELAAGVTFSYELIVEKDVPDILAGPGDGNGCIRPDASGLALLHTVSGAGQSWCRCDVGRCQPFVPTPASIVGGRYPGSFVWHGRNWTGPSDFNNPEGAAFPPGSYDVLVSASGQYGSGVQMLPFTIRNVLPITVVP